MYLIELSQIYKILSLAFVNKYELAVEGWLHVCGCVRAFVFVAVKKLFHLYKENTKRVCWFNLIGRK